MRNNPYNKKLKEHVPLIMQGPSSISVLNASSEQKNFVEKMMTPPKKTYQVKGVSFAMISPPVLNHNATVNTPNILNVEMGQTEVTQELFQAVMGRNTSANKTSLQNPVERITWYECISFCNKLSTVLGLEECYEISDISMSSVSSYILKAEIKWNEGKNGFRLPTEKEWEFFAKAGTNNEWSGTNNEYDLEQYAWYNMNANNKTHPVGEKLPNEWGLYDMSGNVSEWCWDLYDSNDTKRRVVRGGCYENYADRCRVAYHGSDPHHGSAPTGVSDPGRGFRLCRSLD